KDIHCLVQRTTPGDAEQLHFFAVKERFTDAELRLDRLLEIGTAWEFFDNDPVGISRPRERMLLLVELRCAVSRPGGEPVMWVFLPNLHVSFNGAVNVALAFRLLRDRI